MPKTSPNMGLIRSAPSPCAKKAKARLAAGPGSRKSPGGISVAVTIADPSRKIDMTTAAVISSLRVLRMRPEGCS